MHPLRAYEPLAMNPLRMYPVRAYEPLRRAARFAPLRLPVCAACPPC